MYLFAFVFFLIPNPVQHPHIAAKPETVVKSWSNGVILRSNYGQTKVIFTNPKSHIYSFKFKVERLLNEVVFVFDPG